MARHNEYGIEGEALAKQFLIEKGYIILAANFRLQKSEIDLIAQHERVVVFVEVKARSSNKFGFPEEAVSDLKKEKMMEGAEAFLAEQGLEANIRFDVISITKTDVGFEIHHIEDAFF